MSYWTGNYATASIANQYQQFERLGHPGQYTGVHVHNGGQQYFTGSFYGFGAGVMVGSGSVNNFTESDRITLSGGGTIKCRDLGFAVGTVASEGRNAILPVSVMEVSSSATDTPRLYFFKRQQ